ncbi:MAG TPA: hypothetical protein VKX96_12690 [Chloroflexota bacterium]|nr:hypothetical protein [Chloroflexota bacterium]
MAAAKESKALVRGRYAEALNQPTVAPTPTVGLPNSWGSVNVLEDLQQIRA